MNSEKAVPTCFSELSLKINDIFKVEAISTGSRFPVKLIGLVENSSLIVGAPRVNGKSFYLQEGQMLRVRLIADKYACGFSTEVLCSRRLPYIYSHLSYPKKFEAVAFRQASRVKLNTPVVVKEARPGSLHGDWPRVGTIMDISTSGAGLLFEEPLAAVGSELIVSFDTVVDGVVKRMNIAGIVRNINEHCAGKGYQYGVQFAAVSDEERVYISGFIYEQILYQGYSDKSDSSEVTASSSGDDMQELAASSGIA